MNPNNKPRLLITIQLIQPAILATLLCCGITLTTCISEPELTCQNNNDCFENEYCSESACFNRCGDFNGECLPGNSCKNGLCCKDERCTSPVVTIPEGDFNMGCDESTGVRCSPNAKPGHKVSVSEFKIDITEITVSQYRTCYESEHCPKPGQYSEFCNWDISGRENHPVNCIDWFNAKSYCEWAGKRLCSESEWEKAARGNDNRQYPWGNTSDTACNYAMLNGCDDEGTKPAGSLESCIYELHDMLGNVAEWVEDDWHESYLAAPTDGSAWITDARDLIVIRDLMPHRVFRGGAYTDNINSTRSFTRMEDHPDNGNPNIGVRCCY